jgi:hypothetical protein
MSGPRRSSAGSLSPQDTHDLLVLARALRDRGTGLLARPDLLRARALAQLDTPLEPARAQPELLATLSALQRAMDAADALGPWIEATNAEIDELLAMAGPAACPVRMLLSRRRVKDAAEVAAAHLHRFMLSLRTVRFAVELRQRVADLDAWQPDPGWLRQDYQAHAENYHALLCGLIQRAGNPPSTKHLA